MTVPVLLLTASTVKTDATIDPIVAIKRVGLREEYKMEMSTVLECCA